MRRLFLLPLIPLTARAAPPSLPAEYPLHALTHARIYITPEQAVDDATLVIENGRIRQVGSGLTPPPGARIWDCRGKVIHAGFIDPYLSQQELKDGKGQTSPRNLSGLGDRVDDDLRSDGGEQGKAAAAPAPALQAARHVQPQGEVETFQKLRGLGILTAQLVPADGVLRGYGSIYSLRTDRLEDGLLRDESCQVVGLRLIDQGAKDGDYPASLMGNLALLRQAFREADWSDPRRRDPHREALRSACNARLPFYFEPNELGQGLSLLRCLREQPGLPLVWVASGDSALRPEWLEGRLVLTLDQPKLDAHPARRQDRSYAELARWSAGPGLAHRLHQRGTPFSLSLHRLKDWNDYPQRLYELRRAGLAEAGLLESLTRRPAQWLGLDSQLGTLEPGKWATLVVRSGAPFAPGSQVEQCWVQGVPQRVPLKLRPKAKQETRKPLPEPLSEPGWSGPGSVLIQGATVWTQARAGILTDADVLVVGGKIRAVGRSLSADPAVPRVNGRGKHLLPGLIDAHSHTAVVGDVNESTLTTTAQVDIRDVINPLDTNIQRQLAGGVTCAHVLHGSANAIGGRTVTLKWRWGAPARQLILEEAPPGIKFALGENPKQSNWGDEYRQRYPQTRQGVAALIAQRFEEALEYRRLQSAGKSPRPDFGLEALLEVLDGTRLVHCHCYRQDEILMLLQLAERFHFRVATLQHGLEAYKVADEIARHGAGVSTFSDWWGYKQEVIDAIPYNGALLTRRGVEVSFNSDSDELARRLWGEAAKAVRYGGLSETAALDFLTRHPAHQLGVGERLGSLEVGKDGDLSLWSGSPFEPESVCLQTWVEGSTVFEREEYRRLQERRRELRRQWLEAVPAEKTEES